MNSKWLFFVSCDICCRMREIIQSRNQFADVDLIVCQGKKQTKYKEIIIPAKRFALLISSSEGNSHHSQQNFMCDSGNETCQSLVCCVCVCACFISESASSQPKGENSFAITTKTGRQLRCNNSKYGENFSSVCGVCQPSDRSSSPQDCGISVGFSSLCSLFVLFCFVLFFFPSDGLIIALRLLPPSNDSFMCILASCSEYKLEKQDG